MKVHQGPPGTRKSSVLTCGCHRFQWFGGSTWIECKEHEGLSTARKIAVRWVRGETIKALAEEFDVTQDEIRSRIKRAQESAKDWASNPYKKSKS